MWLSIKLNYNWIWIYVCIILSYFVIVRIRPSISSCVGNPSPENIVCTGSSKRDTDRDKYAFSNGNNISWLKI